MTSTQTPQIPYEDIFFMIQQKKMELDATIRDYGEGAIKQLVKAFMTKHPYVTALMWRQYTPYFNDGDPCIFGVNEPEVFIVPELCATYDPHHGKDWHSCEHSYEDGEEGVNGWNLKESSLKDDLKEFAEKTCGNPDLMLAVFGDHVKITCTATDILVEEYEHD